MLSAVRRRRAARVAARPRFRWACMIGLHAWTRTVGPSIYQQGCRHCHTPRRRA